MTVSQADPPFATYLPDAAPRGVGRTALAAALVFVGGYLLITALAGQLPLALAGVTNFPPFVPVLLGAQFAFAIVVTVVGLVAARGSATGKLIGILLVLVGAGVVLAVASLRIGGTVRLGVEATFTIANPWLMTVLLVGAAWLLVRRARLGWLALLPALVLSPLPAWLAMAGVDSALVQLVMFTLSALVGAGILLAGRPWRD